MLASFFKYFFNYIFFAKTRQKLLYLAFIGLFLSSFSLLVLQSSMKGLQSSQIVRSKAVTGHGVIEFKDESLEFSKKISKFLKSEKIAHTLEYNIELLLKHEDKLAPIIVHGLDISLPIPEFLRTDSIEELILPFDLAAKTQVELGSKVQLISPSHVDEFFGDVPRSINLYIEDFISTRVPEVDILHGWTRLSAIQNLIGEAKTNQAVIYSNIDLDELKAKLNDNFGEKVFLQTWEQRNETLVWALKLEAIVMLFLFISMTLLVSLCITLGLLIFFNKIKGDLASFWIMGTSQIKLEKSSWLFLNLMSISAVGLGLICSLAFLVLFQKFGGEIMPDNFVDRKIPIVITMNSVLISFIVPYMISLVFSWLSLRQFKKDGDYLDHVRAIG